VAFGPRQYRRFSRAADRFFAAMPWLWFSGIAALLATMLLPAEQAIRVRAIVCVLTLMPCILGWLAVNGLGIVWKFTLEAQSLRTKRRRNGGRLPEPVSWPVFAFSLSLLVTGVVFLGLAIAGLGLLLEQLGLALG